jgi:hypothetical protein
MNSTALQSRGVYFFPRNDNVMYEFDAKEPLVV